jgi:hypothetical protein
VEARKTFLLKALLSSRSGDDCCVIRPLVRGLWLDRLKELGGKGPVALGYFNAISNTKFE